MNVECSNCPAKYGVPDAKVRGRKVRITCKRCGSPIVIDGTALAAETASRPGARQRTMVGGLDAPARAAAGSARTTGAQAQPASSAAAGKATLVGGVVPRAAVASAPRPAQPARPAPEPEIEPWTVAVTEDDQREMTTPEVVEAYVSGIIDEETFVWRDGMEDWLTPFEIPEISDALRARGLAAPAADGPSSSSAMLDDEDTSRPSGAWREPGKWNASDTSSRAQEPDASLSFDDVTVAMAAPRAQELIDAVASQEAERPAPAAVTFEEDDEATVVANSNEVGAFGEELASLRRAPRPAAGALPEPELPEPELPEPNLVAPALGSRPGAAALRPQREADPGIDLFGAAASAGSDGDISFPPRAPMPSTPPEEGQHGLTGARNESSVLFSLDALAKKDQPKAHTPTKREAEELLLGAPSSPPRSSDDSGPPSSIANLGGTGLFGSHMVAPDFTAPPAESERPPPGSAEAMLDSLAPSPEKKSSGVGLWVALGLLVVVAGGGAALYLQKQKGAPEEAPVPPPASEPAATAEPADEPEEEETAPAAEPTQSAAAEPTEPAAPTPAPIETAAGEQPPTTPQPAQAVPTGTPQTAPASTPSKPEPAKPEQPAPAAGPPFDKAAASSALSAAAANAASSCAGAGPERGSGKVSVTFSNSGRATRTIVTGDFAGSAIGGCIARIFRGATVPAFSGDPVRVTKTVRIQ